MTKPSALASLCDSLQPVPAYASIASDLADIAKTLRQQETKILSLQRELRVIKGGTSLPLIAVAQFTLFHHQGYASPIGIAARKALGLRPGQFLTSEQIREMNEGIAGLQWAEDKAESGDGCRVKNE